MLLVPVCRAMVMEVKDVVTEPDGVGAVGGVVRDD